MNTFQIVTEMNSGAVLFDTAETSLKVDEFVTDFLANDRAKSIKVFRFNPECGNYGLVHQRIKESAERRPIGFGRW